VSFSLSAHSFNTNIYGLVQRNPLLILDLQAVLLGDGLRVSADTWHTNTFGLVNRIPFLIKSDLEAVLLGDGLGREVLLVGARVHPCTCMRFQRNKHAV